VKDWNKVEGVDGELKLLLYNFVDDYEQIEGIHGILFNLDND